MARDFSFNREFDFVRLDGLRRATGRPPHEWDMYILKELIDNALDADDALWRDDPSQPPSIYIHIEYIGAPSDPSQQLFVEVRNNATFPTEKIEDIFATQYYTSRKAFIKSLTRGALGNALKTLLGIPYALRHRVASDWNPDLKPLSLLCGSKEYLPRYIIDSTAQTILFECQIDQAKSSVGTVISVGLDHFKQEVPRTMSDLQRLAKHYHLCNPHTRFKWRVEIEGQEWEADYQPDPSWAGKFRGSAPIHWYSPTAFQDLLGALHRQHCSGEDHLSLPVESACSLFAGFKDKASTTVIVNAFGRNSLTIADIDGPIAAKLYQIVFQRSPRFSSVSLGAIGEKHTCHVLAEALQIDGEVFYSIVSDLGDDPNVPFVIEASVVRLLEGKRQVWTALNFSPTYDDPFRGCLLRPPIKPDSPVFGLRGLLDAYDFDDDSPIALFLHLICPNIEHHEFSKTEINHLPFKDLLGQVLDRLLNTLKQTREEEEMKLEQTIFRALDSIIEGLGENERFIFDQLLEKLRARLSQEPAFSAWLEMPEAINRLQAYISKYQGQSVVMASRVARPAIGILSLPLHPDRHFSILAEHVNRELLKQHHVSKILYVQVRELEPVVIENGWINRLDLALLHNTHQVDELREALEHCVINSDLPILTLCDTDEKGRSIVEKMRRWLDERQLDSNRIINVELRKSRESYQLDHLHYPHSSRLVEMMPSELYVGLLTELKSLGVQVKSCPADGEIRRNLSECFDRLLKGHLWEGLSQQLEIPSLLGDLEIKLNVANLMIDQKLDEQIKQILEGTSCTESYTVILNEVVEKFFEQFMSIHGEDIKDAMKAKIALLKSR